MILLYMSIHIVDMDTLITPMSNISVHTVNVLVTPMETCALWLFSMLCILQPLNAKVKTSTGTQGISQQINDDIIMI